MKLLMYCAQAWSISGRLTAILSGMSSSVLTSPPLTADSFPYSDIGQADVFYVRLHGLIGQPYLYDSKWNTAFSGQAMLESRVGLDKVQLVFIEGCFGARTGLPEMFAEAGARLVIASDTETGNRPFTIGPAGRIGLETLRAIRSGRPVSDVIAKSSFASFVGGKREGEIYV